MRFTRLFAAAAFAAGLLVAQGRGPVNPGGAPPDPQKMIQFRVDRLAAFLSLTDAQKTQALTIFTDAFAAGASARSDEQAARQQLNGAVKANDAAAIDQAAAAIGAAVAQLSAIDGKADAAFYSILTPDQQTKFNSLPHAPFGRPRIHQ